MNSFSQSFRESPFLRSVYPVITHQDIIRKDWHKIRGVKRKWTNPISAKPDSGIKSLFITEENYYTHIVILKASSHLTQHDGNIYRHSQMMSECRFLQIAIYVDGRLGPSNFVPGAVFFLLVMFVCFCCDGLFSILLPSFPC